MIDQAHPRSNGAHRARGYGQTTADQWIVWCEDEHTAVSPILPNEVLATREAELHAASRSHRAYASRVPTEPQPMNQYGDPVTLPEITVRVVQSARGFYLSMAMNSNRDTALVHVPPPMPPEGSIGSLGVHGNVRNESGSPVELICDLQQQTLSAPVISRSLMLAPSQTTDFEFDLGTVSRNASYTVTLRTTTTDFSIQVSGTYTVIIAG